MLFHIFRVVFGQSSQEHSKWRELCGTSVLRCRQVISLR